VGAELHQKNGLHGENKKEQLGGKTTPRLSLFSSRKTLGGIGGKEGEGRGKRPYKDSEYE